MYSSICLSVWRETATISARLGEKGCDVSLSFGANSSDVAVFLNRDQVADLQAKLAALVWPEPEIPTLQAVTTSVSNLEAPEFQEALGQ